MTADQIEAVQSSWTRVAPIAETAAGLFYNRLFELDPSLKPLFKGDIETQGRKLMEIIGVAVSSLNRLDEILPVVREMGRRHATYGVEAWHYDVVGEALLWTLAKGLGDAFTQEVQSAWGTTYASLAGVMKEAAYGSP